MVELAGWDTDPKSGTPSYEVGYTLPLGLRSDVFRFYTRTLAGRGWTPCQDQFASSDPLGGTIYHQDYCRSGSKSTVMVSVAEPAFGSQGLVVNVVFFPDPPHRMALP